MLGGDPALGGQEAEPHVALALVGADERRGKLGREQQSVEPHQVERPPLQGAPRGPVGLQALEGLGVVEVDQPAPLSVGDRPRHRGRQRVAEDDLDSAQRFGEAGAAAAVIAMEGDARVDGLSEGSRKPHRVILGQHPRQLDGAHRRAGHLRPDPVAGYDEDFARHALTGRILPVPLGQPRTDLQVIIVSYRCAGLLRNCLRSLAEHPASVPTTVTVVDSGSGDETPDVVQREFGWAKLIRCRENIGFAAANNLVLSETEAARVLLLNPDTEVRDGSLDRCLERLDREPRVGIVGPKLVLSSGELDHAAKRSFPTPLSALAHFTGLGRRRDAPPALGAYRAPHLGEDEPGRSTRSTAPSCWRGSKPCARSACSTRATGSTWRTSTGATGSPSAAGGSSTSRPPSSLHVKGGSSGERRGWRQEVAFHRGMGRFYRKFYAPTRSLPLNLFVYAGIGAKLAASLALTAVTRVGPAPRRPDGRRGRGE